MRALGTSRLLHRSQWHFSLLYVTSIIVSCFPPSLSSLYKTDKNAAYLLNYHLLHERCVDVLFFSGFYYLQEFYCFLFSLRSGSLTHFLRSWFYFCCFFLYITLLDRLLFPLYVPLYLNLINEFDFAVKWLLQTSIQNEENKTKQKWRFSSSFFLMIQVSSWKAGLTNVVEASTYSGLLSCHRINHHYTHDGIRHSNFCFIMLKK